MQLLQLIKTKIEVLMM